LRAPPAQFLESVARDLPDALARQALPVPDLLFKDLPFVRRDAGLREGGRSPPAVLEAADQAFFLVRLEEGEAKSRPSAGRSRASFLVACPTAKRSMELATRSWLTLDSEAGSAPTVRPRPARPSAIGVSTMLC
jgi:hypothetical protein